MTMLRFNFGETEKSGRRDHDAYMTPQPLVEAIVKRVASLIPTPIRIIEPACGEGEFIVALRQTFPQAAIIGIDIRGEVEPKITALQARFVQHDFLAIPTNLLSEADLIITNPPFKLFAEFAMHALDGMKMGAHLAFVARLGMLSWSEENDGAKMSEAQRTLWTKTYDDLRGTAAISPRPSFTGDGRTDSQEVGVFVWAKDGQGEFRGAFPYNWPAIRWSRPSRPRGRKPRDGT